MLPAALERCGFVACGSAATPATLNPAAPPEGDCGEGDRPQPLEVASLLKLAATNVLFPRRSKEAFVVK